MGDVVYGIAVKNKDQYNNRKCKIVAVLAKHYKVELLQGPSKGAEHKYYHDMVKMYESEAQVATAESDMAAGAATGADHVLEEKDTSGTGASASSDNAQESKPETVNADIWNEF